MAQVQVYTLLGPIAQHCRGCNNTTMIDAYISAVRRFCNVSRWYQSTLAGATTADEPSYNLGSDTYTEIMGVSAIALAESATRTRNLVPGNSTAWNPDDETDIPEFYQYVPHGQIAVHPTPDAAYDMTIGLILQPKINSNSLDDALLVNWSEAFEQGALARLYELPGLPWTDLRKAKEQEDLFESAVRAGASDVAAGYNAGATPTGSYGPRSNIVRSGRTIL